MMTGLIVTQLVRNLIVIQIDNRDLQAAEFEQEPHLAHAAKPGGLADGQAAQFKQFDGTRTNFGRDEAANKSFASYFDAHCYKLLIVDVLKAALLVNQQIDLEYQAIGEGKTVA